MKHLRKHFFNFIILFITILAIAIPQRVVANINFQPAVFDQGGLQKNLNLLSYDEILNLLDDLENGDLAERFSSKELEQINRFLAGLATQGIIRDEDESDGNNLDSDIRNLLHMDPEPNQKPLSLGLLNDYQNVSAIYFGQNDIVLCRGWLSKQWKHTKKFVQKHKKTIIIGAIVIAAATLVVCVTISASSAVAASAAAASSDKNKQLHFHGEERLSMDAQMGNQTPLLQSSVEEQIETFKEIAMNENLLQSPEYERVLNNPSLGEKVRLAGSFLAHESFDGVADLVSTIPEMFEELKEIGRRLVSQDTHLSETSPMENHENLVEKGHELIDKAFSTNLAEHYTPEAKETARKFDPQYAVGVLPLPVGALGPALREAKLLKEVQEIGRIKATQANPIKGWRVGDKINNLTADGEVPKWSTVRKRYWKNEATLHPEKFKEPENLERAKKGLAPQRLNRNTGQIESMELHHDPPQREGGLFDVKEMWPEEHAEADNMRKTGR